MADDNDNSAIQYALGYQDGFLEAKKQFERPKGTWIVEDEENHTYRCSNCKELSCCRGRFCPDCGTEMDNGN